MDWSQTHRTKIVSVFFAIIFVIAAIFVYFNFIKHDPTCFDGKKNQDEHGVDCGGICTTMCIAETHPLIPMWTRPIKITGDVYSVVSYIENQNVGNGVEKIPYEIRMYDDRHILVAAPIKGETFIGPNDRTAIFETGIKVGNRVPQTAFLTFKSTPKFVRIDPRWNDQSLAAENDVLSDLDTVPKLTAEIRNLTLETFRSIPVVAIIYDDKGNTIAASQTFLDEIGPEETLPVYFTWPEPFSGKAARREIIPRVDPFIQTITP